MTLDLSPDQTQALDRITAALAVRNGVPSVLVGPAGTGKTTILGVLAERLKDRAIRYAAPTGRAAKVLSEKLRARGVLQGATTIHRALYKGPRETDKGLDFGAPQEPVGSGGVLIIDEASMVGRQIHDDIMKKLPKRASLLYVGDREQLPPVVKDPEPGVSPWGADFENPTAALTEVHRQALGSPIVRIATAIRTGGRMPDASEPGFERVEVANDYPAAWLAEACREGRDAVALVYTNGARGFTNKLVRANLGLSGGEPVVVGDRLVVTFNAYDADLMNGEVIDVAEVRPAELSERQRQAAGDLVEVDTRCGKTIWICPSMLGGTVNEHRILKRKLEDAFDFLTFARPLVLVDYGWALTVHKSQGSEWAEVAFVADDAFTNLCRDQARPGEGRRMLYTAVTRARTDLHLFDVRRRR